MNISTNVSLHIHNRGEESVKTTTLSSGLSHQRGGGHITSGTEIRGVATERKNTDILRIETAAEFVCEDDQEGSSSTGMSLRHEMCPQTTQESKQRAESRHMALLEKKSSDSSEVSSPVKANTSPSLQSSLQLQKKLSVTSKCSGESKRKSAVPKAGNTIPPLAALAKVSKNLYSNPTSLTSHRQVSSAFLKKSKFKWVKSHNVGGVEPKEASCISCYTSPMVKAVTAPPASSKAGTASGISLLSSVSRRVPAKRFLRKLSPITVVSKTSKYKWVSSSAGAQAKISRKSLSPKVQRAIEKGEATKKVRSLATSTKKKKDTTSFSTSSLSSQYRWKAGGTSTLVGVTAGSTVARRRSAYHWTSEKSNKGVRGGLAGSTVTQCTSLVPSSSPGAFKLRSRMKIIRKTASR